LLQPTSPLRTSDDIDDSLKSFYYQSDKYMSLISVTQVNQHPRWMFKLSEDGFLEKLMTNSDMSKPRQYLEHLYIPNGAIYITKCNDLRKYKTFYIDPIMPYVMPPERSIDIDSKWDFMLAEFLLKKILK